MKVWGAVLSGVSLALLIATSAFGAPFTYNPPGKLVSGSGSGNKTTKDYTPGMRFPLEKAPAYPNSQVWGAGGSKGPGGGQCAKVNYSYPWWDNYCETRSWSMPLCPSGKGHQGQDIRPATCEFNKWWVVASEDGTITSIGTYSVYMKGKSGTTHRYLHMKMSALPIKKGQAVKKGQKLGLVDNDFGGTGTTLHLHYDRKQYVSGVGTVYVPTYMYLVNSYKQLIGDTGPKCDSKACAAKSSCGSWGACGGFSGACDTTGTQARTCTTWACSGDTCKSSSKSETKACTVKTDGKVVKDWGAWSACKTGSACAETGTKTRTRTVCKAGKSASETGSSSCAMKTDGKVVQPWSAWGTCGGFDWPCDESGTHSRSATVCKGGKEVVDKQVQACKVDKDGQEVQPWGPWGACGPKPGGAKCSADGAQMRTRLVCKDEASAPEVQHRKCSRDTEGLVVRDWSPWGACSADPLVCGGPGQQVKDRAICQGGVEVEQQQQQACTVDCNAQTDAGTGDDGSGASASSGGGALDGVSDRDGTGQQLAMGVAAGQSSSACHASSTPHSHTEWLWALLAAAALLLWRRKSA